MHMGSSGDVVERIIARHFRARMHIPTYHSMIQSIRKDIQAP